MALNVSKESLKKAGLAALKAAAVAFLGGLGIQLGSPDLLHQVLVILGLQ